ncbi:MAG: cytochrome c [Candidatus Marinimicrobia bacterium]|jgi:cytochrome c2|nr:cytochrome c [Candidatus Neomarinimicrobiota bacterium]MBT3937827.1 cytochrome c [Candidatus Neomarinimicrobiota bacterium]MBT3960797.1 cytochrome c [Candidatus Neomarinimicrobiota bacterium]MBT4383184.1 cytochrome c [Candidatus Neomarinimicrobiota bacterium]MBT4636023.1 cytochrome c [Candidatus Neomarinimicrobiota bacterium]
MKSSIQKKIKSLILSALIFQGISFSQSDPEEYFEKNCFSCHTIGGGRLTGPDLKDVELRKDAAWLEKFILNPQSVINSGDSYASKILKDARGVIMPKVANLDPSMAKALLKFIREESGKDKSRFGGSTLSDRPLTENDFLIGNALFTGTTRLKNEGPSCLSCHEIAGEGFLGGGLLGPDLTDSYGRLGGKTALAAWLANPSSETMSPIYKQHPIDEEEVLPLVAFLKNKAEGKELVSDTHDFNFMIFGFIGLAIFLVLFDLAWGNRLRAIRKPMVEGEL